jgi:hypothetical protein
MYRVIALVLALVALLCGPAMAQDSGFGLGIILGEPTGLGGKIWLTDLTAVDIAAAWSFSGENAFHIHADYLYHKFDLFDVERGRLPLYFGIGGRIKLEDDSVVSIRFPVGIAYLFEGVPVDLFFEIVPMLDIAPDTDFTLNGGVGFRYFF